MRFLRYFLLLGAVMIPAAFLSTPANAQIGVGIGIGPGYGDYGGYGYSGCSCLFVGILQLLSLRMCPVWLLRT